MVTAESSELLVLCWTMQFAHKQTYAYFSRSVIRNSCICLPPDGAVISIVPIANCSGDTVYFLIRGNARLICSVCQPFYCVQQPYGALLGYVLRLSRYCLHYVQQNRGPDRKNVIPSDMNPGFHYIFAVALEWLFSLFILSKLFPIGIINQIWLI